MTTQYTWSSLQTAVATALVQQPYNAPPADFVSLFPDATSYAEGRISRDLVLLNTRAEATGTTVLNSQTINLGTLTAPSGLETPMVAVEALDITVGGILYSYDRTSLDFIRYIWPQGSLTLAPNLASSRYWAPLNDSVIIAAPTFPAAYVATVTGLFVQTPLSNGQATTYISTLYGDLMFVATMIFMSGALLRNYGAQADESAQAISWEKQYSQLLPGCVAEEARRRGLSVDDLRAQRPVMAPLEG